MFYFCRNKQEHKEGIVIVSISNLFHILDKSRTKENEDSQLNKSSTRSAFFNEQSMLKDKEKDKDNILLKKQMTIINDNEIDTKSKEINDEEIKGNKESKEIKDIKDNIVNNTEKEVKFKNNNTEKGVKFKEHKNTKNLSRANTLKKSIRNKNTNSYKKKSSCCDYFFNLVLCNFLLLIVNNSFIWLFNYMFSDQKNKTYCYSPDIKEFGICLPAEYCPSEGNHDFIYINDDSLSNTEIKNEIDNINKKYLNFYIHESRIFSSLNKKFLKTQSTLSKYRITITSTKNEQYLFNNTFRVGCENYFLEILLMLSIAFILGDIIFGILADIWGRKKILIIAVFCEIAGGYVLFMSTYYISYIPVNNIVDQKINANFLSEFLYNVNDNSDFVNIYKEKFSIIKKEVYETNIIKERFQRYKIFVFMGLYLIFTSNSSVKTITLSYLLENALTEEAMSLYFLLFIISIPLSIFFTTLLVIYTNSFHFPTLILMILELIIIILIMLFFL